MSIYDYEYNDIIKAQNIINSVRAICDKEADNNKEDTFEFLKYNNMVRSCTATWLLLDFYGKKIQDYQKLKDVRNIIYNSPIEDYELNSKKLKPSNTEYTDSRVLNEIKDQITSRSVISIHHYMKVAEDLVLFKFGDTVYNLIDTHDNIILYEASDISCIASHYENFVYKKSLIDYEANKDMVYNDLIMLLYNLCNKHNCNELNTKEHKDFQLNVINEIYTFIKKHTNICKKLNVVIDFASGTLDFINLDFKKIYVGLNVKRDVRIVNASENYKTLYTIDYEIYKNNKEQFYKDLYTILVLNFNEGLKQE